MTKFKAPTEELELEIVEFCLNTLGLGMGQFWYDWFTSHNINNATLHINCCSLGMKDFLTKNISKLSFVGKIHEIREMDISNFIEPEEFPIKYTIHFKIK